MSYIEQYLTFTDNEVCYMVNEGPKNQVMMDWEMDIMEAHAKSITKNGGDILEIGFGMGISAGFIQSNSINSHTIVEIHPQIIIKAQEWAKDKPNVNIIEGNWIDNLDKLLTYDGLFYDTWCDDNIQMFFDLLPTFMKKGGRASWFNPRYYKGNKFGITGEEYTEHTIELDPKIDKNNYFNNDTYYLPTKQF
jgi:spermidine synthase|tara:strand:- start:57 stop:632 length:576 start_codon:yes stop_codon:yes gene_type:complete